MALKGDVIGNPAMGWGSLTPPLIGISLLMVVHSLPWILGQDDADGPKR